MKNPKSREFRQPFPWKSLKLMDYPEIVKEPMNLQRVRKKLNCKRYPRFEDFVKDIRLIWENCFLYNPEGSNVHTLASFKQEFAEQELMSAARDLGVATGCLR